MKNILIVLIVLIQCIKVNCQTNFGKSWVIGLYGYTVKFDAGSIIHDTTNYNVEYGKGRSIICDSAGDILLACNGMNLYNKNGILIEGGDTLLPKDYYNFYGGNSPIPQSSIILPMEFNKFYLITPTANDTQFIFWNTNTQNKAPFNILLYNVIDMNANAGLGKVINRMIPLIENKELSKPQMMACRHANGKDWWLLKMSGDSNIVYKFLFTQDSVYDKGKQLIPFPWLGYYDIFGQMVFSNDGTKWATTYSNNSGDVDMADFDRCTGMLSNFSRITVPSQATNFPPPNLSGDTANYGLAFSANGKMLYISRYTHVMQYNLTTQSFYKVCELDTTFDQFMGYTTLQLGPDNKIYIGLFHGFSKQMSVIDNPDVSGVGCNFCRKCLRAKSVYGYMAVPPCMPNYELGASGEGCWPLSSQQLEVGSEQLVVFPNPSSSKLKIEHGELKLKELYNSIGQLILNTQANEIDVSHLSKGVYYLKCEQQGVKVVVE